MKARANPPTGAKNKGRFGQPQLQNTTRDSHAAVGDTSRGGALAMGLFPQTLFKRLDGARAGSAGTRKKPGATIMIHRIMPPLRDGPTPLRLPAPAAAMLLHPKTQNSTQKPTLSRLSCHACEQRDGAIIPRRIFWLCVGCRSMAWQSHNGTMTAPWRGSWVELPFLSRNTGETAGERSENKQSDINKTHTT